MPKKKMLMLIMSIVFIILFVIGASYAFWTFTSNNKTLVFHTSSNIENYIHYSDGEGIFSGTLQVGDDYTDGIHTTISIYKDNVAANVNLKATIHMDVNQIGTNMQNSKALKWAVTSGNSSNPGSIISTGDFVGATNNSSMILASNLDVTLTEKEYTIWIWLDERENPNSSLTGETLDTNVWTEINQFEGIVNSFEITKLSASYQVINATVIDRKYKVVSYAVSTSSGDPGTWITISTEEQNNIYNLRYLAPSAGTYYVWFKDSNDAIITSEAVTVSAVNNNAPVCSFGEFGQTILKYNGTTTIDITCTDENTTIITDLKLSDLTRTGSTVTLTNLTKTKIANGYKYTITVTAGSTAGNTSITLPANKVINNFNLGNEQIQSGNVTVNNDGTAPTLTLSVTSGTTYAIQRDATITIADNVRLRAGTYTIKYDWSTTALTCNQLGNSTNLVVSQGESTKSATVTITNKTGAGKLYICNDGPIYDEAGNSLAANTARNSNMYLDNGKLVLESNGGVKATLTVINSTVIPAPYYFMMDTQPITCDENTSDAEFTPSNVNNYTFTVNQTGTYYVCAKMSDTSGNTSYLTGSVQVNAYLKTLSGDNDAFKESSYKTNITDIYFVNNMNIPNDAVAQYNLDDTNVGLIKGWIVNNTEETGKYKLYIGSNETIYGRNLTKTFENMTGLKNISFDNFDTSEATNMTNMFAKCSGLTSLNLSSFDTSKVTTTDGMFNGCSNLLYLDLSSFDTSIVTRMNDMFYNCKNLNAIYVSSSKWSTNKVGYGGSMFTSDTNLVGGNGTAFNASNVTSTYAVIDAAGTPGYLSELPSTNALEYSSTGAATTKYLSTDILKNQIKKITFTNSISGHTANGTDTWDVSFQKNGSVLAWVGSADGNGLYEMTIGQTGGVVPVSGSNLFANLTNLTTIDGMSYFDTSNVTNMKSMFEGCSNLSTIDFTNFVTSNVVNMSYMFRGCHSLASLNLSSFNTTKVKDMSYMFDMELNGTTTNLASINLSSFNTSNVTNMTYMFNRCSQLTTLNLSNFNTLNVTNMTYMFRYCSGLTSLNVSSFNTSNVINMAAMFQSCSGLTTLDVSSFNTSSVQNMSSMFYNCSGLSTINLRNFNTTSLQNSSDMFHNCTGLTYIDLSSWNISALTNMSYMFRHCNNVLSIYVSSSTWTTSAISNGSYPFYYNGGGVITNITGGNGTMKNNSYQTYTYARIDADGAPGYLTAAPTVNVLEPGSVKANNTKYLSTDILKSQIKKITFTNSISGHTANGTDTWDVSFQKNGSVLAWVGSADGNGLYEMTIGQAGGVKALNGFGLFSYLNNLTTIDGMEYLDVSDVTLMRSMFQGCSSLTTLDLSSWDTSKVKLMNNMFNGCSGLTTIYASDLWDTSNVIDSTTMFTGATNLPNFSASVVDATNAHTGSGGYLTYKAYP